FRRVLFRSNTLTGTHHRSSPHFLTRETNHIYPRALSPFPPPQNLVYNKLIIPKGVRIVMEKNITVKMNVQTMYKGDLLRAGKIYTVNEETAERWIVSGLAEKETSKENNQHE